MNAAVAHQSVVFSAHPAITPATVLAWVFTLGLFEVWRRRHTFTVTPTHVLVSRGVFLPRTQSLALERLDHIYWHSDASTGRVILSAPYPRRAGETASGLVLAPISNSQANRLLDAIDAHTPVAAAA